MTGPRIGSLFSGYGALDLAALNVFGGAVAWHAEIDPAASKVLAARFPDAPNLGDITRVAWRPEHAVDVLTGGFPCQDISAAGQRAGMGGGTRSGLWAEMARAVAALRPVYVVVENVRALLRGGDFCESCDACEPPAVCPARSRLLDDRPGRPVHRSWFGVVLGDLARIGYDAAWCCLRASDVGAPHHRDRVFVLAWPGAADPGHGTDPEWAWRPGRDRGQWAAVGEKPAIHYPGSAENTDGEPSRQRRQSAPGQTAGGWAHSHPRRRGRAPAPDAGHDGREGRPQLHREPGRPETGNQQRDDAHRLGVAHHWGSYAPAIQRWETVTGRAAPAPTVAGTRGQPKLNPGFVEWMMGLEPGWVTAVPGLGMNDQLRLLGNGVVPQQGAAALRWLHAQAAEAEAAS